MCVHHCDDNVKRRHLQTVNSAPCQSSNSSKCTTTTLLPAVIITPDNWPATVVAILSVRREATSVYMYGDY